jgi:hypothetical protein
LHSALNPAGEPSVARRFFLSSRARIWAQPKRGTLRDRRASSLRIVLIALAMVAVASASGASRWLRVSKAATEPTSIHGDSRDPWTASQIVQPAELVKELNGVPPTERPIVVCVGMRTYFKAAHVPGAVLHGPAMLPAGLDDLKKWAEGLSRKANLVVYCGCCPLSGCPNLRPGFLVLREMGFQHLRVLTVPNSFATDWVEKGYPVERGD